MQYDLTGSTIGDIGATDRDWYRVAAATIGLVFSLGTLLVYTFGVFVLPLSKEFGWSRTQLAGAVAVSQLSFAVTAPFWGAAVDRFGPRPIILLSVVGLSALVASLGLLTPHLWHFYLVFLAVSFVGGAASPIGYSAVLVRKFDRHLGLALGLCLMGVGIGASVLPPSTQALLAEFGWRGAYVALGVLTFVLTMPAALVATRRLPRPASRAIGGNDTSILPLLTTRAFRLMAVTFFLLGAVSIGMLTSIVPIMIDRGFSGPAAAQFAAVTGLTTILGRGGIGWVLDRFHAPYIVAAAALLAMCSALLLAYGTGAGTAYLAAVLLGMVVGAEVDFTAFLRP